jgi:RNA polymerase sigma-70 factor, ECF subfamily
MAAAFDCGGLGTGRRSGIDQRRHQADDEAGGHNAEAGSARNGHSGGAAAAAEVQQILDLYADPLLRFLLRLTLGERHLAMDLLQETLLRAWRNRGRLPADPEIRRKWLYTIAKHVAIDAARARAARPAEIGVTDFEWLVAHGDDMESVVAVHTIRSALPKLSADHRTVLIELYYRGSSVTEIATRLGIPKGTVKSRAHRALRSLRAIVEPAEGG